MPTFTERPVSTSTTATDTTTSEACPYCRTNDRTRRTSDTGRVRAWVCDHCDTSWAYTTRAGVLSCTF
jgi:ribosomal protein L37AE/L43A